MLVCRANVASTPIAGRRHDADPRRTHQADPGAALPAARLLGALPSDLAVKTFDEPELVQHRAAIVAMMPDRDAADLVDAMSADQQADLFRELEPVNRVRLLQTVTPETRAALRLLLQYPPDTAGGIMTTEFVSVPADWTAERTLSHVRQVGGRKETVYAIYVTDPTTRGLIHVVSPRAGGWGGGRERVHATSAPARPPGGLTQVLSRGEWVMPGPATLMGEVG